MLLLTEQPSYMSLIINSLPLSVCFQLSQEKSLLRTSVHICVLASPYPATFLDFPGFAGLSRTCQPHSSKLVF